LDDGFQNLNGSIYLFFRVVIAEAEAQGSLNHLWTESHGNEDMGGIQGSGRAGGSCGYGDSLEIERNHRGFTLQSFE
jgi:hypothetical protein